MKPTQQSLPSLEIGASRIFSEVAFPAQAAVLARLVRESGKPMVHVVPQDKDIASLASLVRFLDPELEILEFPAWDTLPYDRVSPSTAILSQRLKVLGRLTQPIKTPYLLLTTINAISQKLPPKREIARAFFNITPGSTLDRNALFQFLNDFGYRRASKVMEAGEYAVRGALIDIFPSGGEAGIRIDCFGDEVESLKSFDPLSQISAETVASLTLLPISEVMLNEASIALFREHYLKLFGAVTRDDPLYASISEGRPHAGMEHWLPLFYDHLDTLASYTSGAMFSRDQRVDALHAERGEAIADYYNARVMHAKNKHDGAPYHPIAPETLFLKHDVLLAHFDNRPICIFSAFALDSSPRRGEAGRGASQALPLQSTEQVSPPPNLPPAGGGIIALNLRYAPQLFTRRHEEAIPPAEVAKQFIAESNKPVILAANSFGSADRLHKLVIGHGPVTFSDAWRDVDRSPALTILPIERGYETPDYIMLSEQDIFGERIIRTQKKKRPAEAFLQEAASFQVGEYIVHKEHGIGRYAGLLTLEVNDTKHDCLKLEYDGGTLFLPVENIDLLSRYGATEGEIALDKLGGVAWQKRKSALKKRIKIAAEALIKTAAERAAKTATAFNPPAGLYDEFCRRFPYTETEDQLSAIEDVRADLNSGRVTDRLICGDVGFGKTEVAMRAAFVAAAHGAQVALIAPTTLLARQHFINFRERFRDLPYTIRMLSRLTPAKDAAKTREELAEGKVHIVIGTHALLANSIQFKNLELLIVDEEQHFGVGQKEKLKSLKSDIHVLTMSATPIPRTLQMALSGVRELSLITTPPVDRLAVRTYVMPVDWVILREALMREYHRGGKSFFVTPRVKFMDELHAKLREHVPELKIAVAHGQLGATALDKVMNEFYDGKYDVLLSTAIIESGIDVPTANTMIIDRAHLFGLAQLYQLRGRVGRSKTRAYAYFTLPHHHLMNRDAERRLEVMQQLDSLGAGFSLASHDMDIRGYGNLLGDEQSGHIKEVGMELYQAMLEEAIADLRRKQKAAGPKLDLDIETDWSPQINLGMSVLIPESYVEDLSLRLSLYRRAGSLETNDMLESFAAELIDRFGPMPEEVEHFLAVLRIKIICKHACIHRLDAGPKGVVVAFRHNKFGRPEALLAHITKHANRIKLRADQTLFVSAPLADEEARLKTALSVAQEIAALLS